MGAAVSVAAPDPRLGDCLTTLNMIEHTVLIEGDTNSVWNSDRKSIHREYCQGDLITAQGDLIVTRVLYNSAGS